jgi:GT2 family glycosyltransferase
MRQNPGERTIVVVATTHRVPEVTRLVDEVFAAHWITEALIVDNSPRAASEPWKVDSRRHLVIEPVFLGAGEAFRRGVAAALALGANRVLLLDHDARVAPASLDELFRAAAHSSDRVYSCNQNGSGSGWSMFRRGRFVPIEWPSEQLELASVDLAQWSGLLLPHGAAEILSNFRTEYFFGWDDWLFTHQLAASGWRVSGVPHAVVENARDARTFAWRSYYQSRNQFLFLRDCGVRDPAVYWRAVVQRTRVGLGQARNGKRMDGLATSRGTLAGILGRRGLHSRYRPGAQLADLPAEL